MEWTKLSGRSLVAVLAVLMLVAAGCGDDSDETTEPAEGSGGDESGGDAEMVNACPDDGCTITITDVVAEGDELRVTWDTNFAPDVARNHIHVYWDNFEPDQVSGDAESRGVEQGDWVPTGDNPEFVTVDTVSVAVREGSTTICVTAADREHSVLDSALEDCRDVGDLLS